MTEQLHRRFSTEEVKVLLEKYLHEKVKLTYIVEILNITRRRFFQLLRDYKEDPDNFSIQYKRKSATRRISEKIEKNIINELEKGKKLIEDKEIPITFYNYSYIKNQIYQTYGQKVSLPTIIARAKKRVSIHHGRERKNSTTEKFLLTTLESLSSTIPPTTSSPPMLIRNGISSPAWMITADSFSMRGSWKGKPPGIIS